MIKRFLNLKNDIEVNEELINTNNSTINILNEDYRNISFLKEKLEELVKENYNTQESQLQNAEA